MRSFGKNQNLKNLTHWSSVAITFFAQLFRGIKIVVHNDAGYFSLGTFWILCPRAF